MRESIIMKRIGTKKIIVSIILLVVLSAIAIGVFGYYNNIDRIKGQFFRKMYGSIGIADGDSGYSLRIDLFCFNSDVGFLKDKGKLAFDNKKVEITNVDYEKQSSENNLDIYSVYLSISVAENGRFDVSNLVYSGGDTEKVYPLGKISFVYEEDKDGTYLAHGCDTTINDGKATFTFLDSNDRAFKIVDVILAEEKGVNYICDKNVSYTVGKGIAYEIGVDYSVNDGDMFVMQPIFVIKFDGDEVLHYFAPGMLVCSGENLTYPEIREYVK